ncbi:MAG TPA: hypothetical protein EYQ31_04560 [Candidatus Handelsmanbacteria bacterium]|nr:hypothetical protein [Candidatus Handelsmanbacteria bacterium]
MVPTHALRTKGDQFDLAVAIGIAGGQSGHRQIIFEQPGAALWLPSDQTAVAGSDQSRPRTGE